MGDSTNGMCPAMNETSRARKQKKSTKVFSRRKKLAVKALSKPRKREEERERRGEVLFCKEYNTAFFWVMGVGGNKMKKFHHFLCSNKKTKP